MLFKTEYVGIEIEKAQGAMEYFFRELANNPTKTFSANLFPENFRPYLYKYRNRVNGFRKYVDIFKAIFDLYHSDVLSDIERVEFVQGFFDSNDIEGICGDPKRKIIHFDDLKKEVQEVVSNLLWLYENLSDIVNVDEHFTMFRSANGKICPVCGLETGLQYDHYFPIGRQNPVFPFSCINPHNLIPICQGCNGPKSKKLVMYNSGKADGKRIAVFYPYANVETWKHLKFSLQNIEVPSASNKLGTWKVVLSIKSAVPNELKGKINHWKDFFEIENRYSNDIKAYISVWISIFREQNISLEKMIRESKPTSNNIRRTDGIILQWLFFDLLQRDNRLKEMFLSKTDTSSNPNDLLQEQLAA